MPFGQHTMRRPCLEYFLKQFNVRKDNKRKLLNTKAMDNINFPP